ncbi:MAG: ABC transporter substrate-binding protein [Saprospiraceae bacterium]
MIKKGYCFITISVCLLFFISISCKRHDESNSGFSLNVRLPSEPENLHPFFTKSSYGIQILGLIMLPAAEFDPITLKPSPLLITEIPQAEPVKTGKHAGGNLYRMKFRPEATWDNGNPITAKDYLFSIKAAYNPHITAASITNHFSFLSEIIIDSADSKSVSIYVDSNYILSLETITNFNIYPAHVYDPQNVMAGFTLDELRDPEKQWTSEQDTLLKLFAAQFESTQFLREKIEGSGPYKFDSWVTGEYIRIKRKEMWWGDKLTDRPLLLQGYPQEITYRIITDAATAEAALKAGEIDVLSEMPPASFMKMKNDQAWTDKFEFFTPPLLQINYLELNNRDPVLSDPKIRKALAYAIDYDGIMNNLLVGLGQRTIGPIHPQRSYFHKELQPIRQDLAQSLALIKEAGWNDTNGNGTPDKVINGKLEELSITMKITNKEEGQSLASIVRDNAKKAGFDVQIEVLDPSKFNQDVRQYNFDIVPMRTRPYQSIDDPYTNYYSTSNGNRSGFRNQQADEAISDIRTAASNEERDSNYYEFQEIIYNEQPAIYLYVPLERIVVSKKYKVISSSRKPGYFENLFQLSG